jgi:sestrin
VVHAIVLLVHFHCLCSFVYGCGVSEEDTKPRVACDTDMDAGVGVDTLMQRMKTLSEQQEEFTAEERAKRFERVELQSIELGTSTSLDIKPSIGHFVEDPDFIYEDFARRGEDSSIPTFRIQVGIVHLHLWRV